MIVQSVHKNPRPNRRCSKTLLSPCTGPIPSWLEELNGLKELDVSFNALTGEVSICFAVSGICVVTDYAFFSIISWTKAYQRKLPLYPVSPSIL